MEKLGVAGRGLMESCGFRIRVTALQLSSCETNRETIASRLFSAEENNGVYRSVRVEETK